MLLTITFFGERQEPADQENQAGSEDQEIEDPVQQRPDPVIPGFVVIAVSGAATHSADLTSVLRVVTKFFFNS
jgi:hypothetical protein